MAFDPTKPANNSAVNSAELREQLTSLKALIDLRATTTAMESYVLLNCGGNCGSADDLAMTVSDPPTQAEVQLIADKVDELIHLLKRVP